MEDAIEKVSVLIVDDHPLFRKAIKRLLANIPFVVSFDEAENGAIALELMEKKTFQVVLLDLMMPVMDGEEAARIIRKRFPTCRIIILTMSDSKVQMVDLLEIGVLGYVLKSTDEEELAEAIVNVSQGIPYLSQEVENVWDDFLRNKNKLDIIKNSNSQDKFDLSDREIEIIRLLCKQLSTKEISEKISLSLHTVNTHRKNIMKKLDTDNVVGIAIYAMKNGLFVP